MAKCKIFSVEKTIINFEDGRTAAGCNITFGSASHKTDEDGRPAVEGHVPFCYLSGGRARTDKFVGEKKFKPEGYVPAPGDTVDIEFELGTSSIVSVVLIARANATPAGNAAHPGK